ncbi:Hypothetical predicted protein [Podarcis lilfordi]|uniref:Uncharacterized protein n=1 Tax=Podarcis lilfordi TaxID=74358 RepID=A0AA35JX52_9SAUR|nr:Hypothetical predicted protein [Podarcis lilfordi]
MFVHDAAQETRKRGHPPFHSQQQFSVIRSCCLRFGGLRLCFPYICEDACIGEEAGECIWALGTEHSQMESHKRSCAEEAAKPARAAEDPCSSQKQAAEAQDENRHRFGKKEKLLHAYNENRENLAQWKLFWQLKSADRKVGKLSFRKYVKYCPSSYGAEDL